MFVTQIDMAYLRTKYENYMASTVPMNEEPKVQIGRFGVIGVI